jgi:ribose 5-phosphate isomerase A
MSDVAKINAAAAALDLVRDGMVLGLGTGSTAAHFVRLIGRRVMRGLDVVGAPTSEATRILALECGVPLIDPDKISRIDLAVDGADEADTRFNLIKGGGGALLREKIIAAAAEQFVVIVDESKAVETLGAFPLPVEVTPFAFPLTATRIYHALKKAGCGGADVTLRTGPDGQPYRTDGGNFVLDCSCKIIADPAALADALDRIVGVVEHGLFIGMTRTVIVGRQVGADVREL